jgi:hypothetical protein
MSEHDDQDSNSDEDLLHDLEIWAEEKDSRDAETSTKNQRIHQSDDKQQQPSSSPSKPSTAQSLSLHITNLPETADKSSIHEFFTKNGCSVTSVRLVYGQTSSKSWNKPIFKGVAFIDLSDKKSYEKALSFHRQLFINSSVDDKKKKQIKKSRINVRPTRTKEELAAIVQQTKERVEKLKKESLDKKEPREMPTKTDNKMTKSMPSSSGRSTKRKREDASERKDTVSKRPKTHKSKNDTPTMKSPKERGVEKSESSRPQRRVVHKRRRIDVDRKLTKKERAKKAAIIRSK